IAAARGRGRDGGGRRGGVGASPGRGERDQLHDPVAGGAERGGGAVGAGGGDDAILDEVAVGVGDHAGGEAGAGAGRESADDVGGEEEDVGRGRRERATVRGSAGACSGHGGVHGADVTEAAELEDVASAIGRRRGEVDGDRD